MSSFRIRPRFKHLIQGNKDELEGQICEALDKEGQFIYHHLDDHIYIKIHPDKQHIWSPQLHVSFEQEDEAIIVRGLYGPNPTVWAFFFFGYAVIGLVILFVGMWGFSLWSLDQDASILWVLPVMVGVGIIMYLISQAGQKLGAQQMFDIHHFYESITKDKVVVS